MKIRYSLLFCLLAISLPAPAQEPNPFVKKGDAAKVETPPGDSYVAVVEHITVPPDLIGDWIRHNSITGDADGLRALVQQWIDAGKASLEFTTVASGVADRQADFASIVELIYPTEYEPAGPEVWPLPTSFETRNTGCSTEWYPTTYPGGGRLSLSVENVHYTGSTAWDLMSRRTRHEDDIHMPEFRSERASWGAWKDLRTNPFRQDRDRLEPPSKPPFALPPGKYQLIARVDPLPSERAPGGVTRLVFLRGEFVPRAKAVVEAPELRHLAYELVEVPHADFSAWQRSKKVGEIPTGAWEVVEGMRKADKVETIGAGSGLANDASKWLLENNREEIYPTEYMPTDRRKLLRRWQSPHRQKEDGQMVEGLATFERYEVESEPGIRGAGMPTSFETRNTGTTIELQPGFDESGLLANLSCQYVVRLGDTVARRVDSGGEWIPDCTMPLFASNHFKTTCRITPGTWTLVGTGSRFTGLGKSDPGRCLLLFVKVE